MQNFVNKRWSLGLAAIALAAVMFAGFNWAHVSAGTVITIPPASSARVIGVLLKQQGVIQSERLFQARLWWCGCASNLHAGNYAFSGTWSMGGVIERLRTGGDPLAQRVTIPEGLRSDQIAALLVARGVLQSPQEFLQIVRTPQQSLVEQFPWLSQRPSDQGLEGFLFGDTYEFLPNTPARNLVEQLLSTFGTRVITLFFGDGAGSAAQLYPTLVLASIVELEVQTPSDRAMVADVFQKRLAVGIPLQADSTVNFITGRNDPRARLDDTLISSPYNTYRNRGLPPSPISNPSLASIRAVVEPQKNPYYFFLTDAEGGVHYARTLEEHQRNRVQFLK
ncbi:endolytic transglycosylase MltG [Candidatus Uhrbacteria bacterium]|nr:endolytic transglycosylase MltG [Candidatus Uhrbacteria bacterium]